MWFDYIKQLWKFGCPASTQTIPWVNVPRIESPKSLQQRKHTIPYLCATYACVGMDIWITYCEVVFDHGPEDVVRAVPGLIAHSEPDTITCPKCRKAMEI